MPRRQLPLSDPLRSVPPTVPDVPGVEGVAYIGEGDPTYHRQLKEIHGHYPEKIGLFIGFDEGLAHLVEAGADMFLMPSQFEPSGLNQLYSLRYGTVPVVRAVGGLYDTIADATPEAVAAGTATGFRFGPYTPTAFQQTVHRALACYHYRPEVWRQIVKTGMKQDWSWGQAAGKYVELYQAAIADRVAARAKAGA